MKRKGFTLLELLVAVLIIGILGTAAYSSCRTVLWKARTAKLMPLGKTLIEHAQLFYLANGHYPTSSELEGIIPTVFQFDEFRDSWVTRHTVVHCAMGSGLPDEPASCQAINLSVSDESWLAPVTLSFFIGKNDSGGPHILCVTPPHSTSKTAPLQHRICRSLGGTSWEGSSFIYSLD